MDVTILRLQIILLCLSGWLCFGSMARDEKFFIDFGVESSYKAYYFFKTLSVISLVCFVIELILILGEYY